MVVENGRRILKVAVEVLMDVSSNLPEEKVDEVIKTNVERNYGVGTAYTWADVDDKIGPLDER